MLLGFLPTHSSGKLVARLPYASLSVRWKGRIRMRNARKLIASRGGLRRVHMTDSRISARCKRRKI